MGIPHFFGHYITSNIPSSISKEVPRNINTLSIDMNSIIHMSKAEVCNKYKTRKNFTQEQLYRDIFEKVSENIDRIIQSINPKVVFLAVDGVAPMAKICQQRIRRHKTGEDQEFSFFDSNLITPGTDFMFEFDEYFLNYLSKYNKKTIEILYSSVKVRGEGEHKIFDYYRNSNKVFGQYDVIYGNDADFLIISLFCDRQILIFREDNQGYDVIDISEIRNYITKEIHIEDFVVILNLIGNDFLPKIFCYQNVKNSIEYLMAKYKESKCGNLYNNNEINYINLTKFLNHLALEEIELIEENSEKLSSTINLGEDFINNYYSYFMFKGNLTKYMKEVADIDEELLSEIAGQKIEHMNCKYIQMMNWVLNYYKNGRASVNEECFYPYLFSPLLNNLKDFSSSSKTNTQMIKDYKNKKYDMNMLEQLICVIPLSSCKILPKEISSITYTDSPLSYLYVKKFQEEKEGILPRHYFPIIPFPDKTDVREYVLKLDKNFLSNYKCNEDIYKFNTIQVKENKRIVYKKFEKIQTEKPKTPSRIISTNKIEIPNIKPQVKKIEKEEDKTINFQLVRKDFDI